MNVEAEHMKDGNLKIADCNPPGVELREDTDPILIRARYQGCRRLAEKLGVCWRIEDMVQGLWC